DVSLADVDLGPDRGDADCKTALANIEDEAVMAAIACERIDIGFGQSFHHWVPRGWGVPGTHISSILVKLQPFSSTVIHRNYAKIALITDFHNRCRYIFDI